MSEFSCFKCGDGNTPLYCANCAREGWVSPEVAKKVRELIKDLDSRVPRRPRAITWEVGTDILNYVQDVFLPEAVALLDKQGWR